MKGIDIMIIRAYVGFYGENPVEDKDNDLRYQTKIEINDSIFDDIADIIIFLTR